MTTIACEIARREGFAEVGQTIVAIAGMPFGTPGTTNLMRIATV
jgi:pyruvate kinase